MTPIPFKLLETSIAGFQRYEGERLFNQLNIGDQLQLRRAPQNKPTLFVAPSSLTAKDK